MGRKVFISFLGNGFYEPTQYVEKTDDEATAVPLRFIQEASINKFCKDYSQEDCIFIFTTKGALLNWHEGEHKNFKSNSDEWYEGLHTRLRGLELPCSIENIMIPEGKSTNEIWEIFRIVYEKLEDKDELIFDITHGFRSLPMLNMVLINYAKLLKNIHVKGIYYGAFEAKYSKNDFWYSPVWNLIEFEELQNWTNSANIFLKTGNAIELAFLIEDSEFNSLKENLLTFSQQLLVNRGPDIYEGTTAISLKENLQAIETNSTIPALTPILRKIKNEFNDYSKESATNGFLAVRWCINNGLIQQAATLLEEFIVTFVMCEINQVNYLKNIKKRETISAALKIGTEQPFEYFEIPKLSDKITEEYQNMCKEILSWQELVVPIVRMLTYKKKVGVLLFEISKTVRNDINHAGFREDAKQFDGFESSIKKRYNETKKLIKQIKQIDLPEL